MPEKELPRYSIYSRHRRICVRFSYRGKQYRKPFAEAGALEDGEISREAEKEIRRTIAEAEKRERAFNSQNPIDLYETRLKTRGLDRQKNCTRYHERLKAYFPNRDIRTLTRQDVMKWRDWLLKQKCRGNHKGTLSAKSVAEHIDYLAAIFNHAGLANPCRGVERPRLTERQKQERIQFFTPDEMESLFSAVKGTRFENAFMFLAFTGCRSGEMQGIRKQDIVESERIVYLIGKNDSRHPLKLTGPCSPAWDALVAEVELSDAEYVFPQGESWVRDGMDRAGAAVWGGVQINQKSTRLKPNHPCHPHMLRHTFASMALLYWRPTWPIALLSKWLWHKDINTTYKQYGHWVAVEAPSAWEPASSTELARSEKSA